VYPKNILNVCLFATIFIGACGDIDRERENAVSPSSKFWLSANDLASAKKAANNGDAAAMRKLADHYLSSSQEVEGIQWLEKLGDGGDLSARKSVIDYYEHVPQPDDKKGYAVALRKKWNMRKR